jgi:hypothetical protein
VRGSAKIVPRPLLKTLDTHHRFLQSVRVPMRFVDFFPASMFVYRLQKSDDARFHFNFRDLPPVLGIALQMGSVGIIAVLQDGGMQQEHFSLFLDRYQQYPLHPMQFLELISRIFYKATLFNRVGHYLSIEATDAIQVIQMPLQGFSAKPLYDDWSQEAYAHVLSFHLAQPLSVTFDPPDRVMTILDNSDGVPVFMDINIYPWPGTAIRKNTPPNEK